jgi:flagellum-specific ATP synthase
VNLLPLRDLEEVIRHTEPYRVSGRVTRVAGLLVEGSVPGAHLGMVCRLRLPGTNISQAVPAEVVALRDDVASLMPLGGVQGIQAGTEIHTTNERPVVPVGMGLLGRVLDGWGSPIDRKGPISRAGILERYPLDPPHSIRWIAPLLNAHFRSAFERSIPF